MRAANFFLLFVIQAGMAAAAPPPLEVDIQASAIEVAVATTIDSFVGRLEKFDAVIDPGPPGGLPAGAKVNFNFASLKTGNLDRDAAMLKWLEFDSHPGGTFLLRQWRQDGATNVALGDLTIHGAARAVEIPVSVHAEGGLVEISGRVEFDYRDFHLPKIRKALILTVHPVLRVSFHLVGKLPPAK